MPAEVFTEDELKTLFAVFDTVIPAMPIEELLKRAPHLAEYDIELVDEFASQVPSSIPELREEVVTFLPKIIKPAQIAELKQVLGLMR